MDRVEIYKRANYQCELTGSTSGLQLHHIVRRRYDVDRPENLILLCWEMHHGDMGAHNNRQLDLQLKRGLQKYYRDCGYTREKIKKLMGGRFYPGKIVFENVKSHFEKVRECHNH